jgi:hypothetical protein
MGLLKPYKYNCIFMCKFDTYLCNFLGIFGLTFQITNMEKLRSNNIFDNNSDFEYSNFLHNKIRFYGYDIYSVEIRWSITWINFIDSWIRRYLCINSTYNEYLK